MGLIEYFIKYILREVFSDSGVHRLQERPPIFFQEANGRPVKAYSPTLTTSDIAELSSFNNPLIILPLFLLQVQFYLSVV
jgi:hypothetical protein